MQLHQALIGYHDAFKKQPTPHMLSNIEGQIYELYCYNRILDIAEDIKIVKSNCVDKEAFRQFSYSKTGKINYHSSRIHLAEFDILGLKDNEVFWWETTKSDLNSKALKIEISRKLDLLNKIFKNYKINFSLILPRKMSVYNSYPIILIEEPDYSKYINDKYFNINEKVIEGISLFEFENFAEEYDYIEDIITNSIMMFSKGKIDLVALQKSALIEHLYDIDNMSKNNFRYYDVLKAEYGVIELIDNKIYKNKKIVPGIKKSNQEIKQILKRIS